MGFDRRQAMVDALAGMGVVDVERAMAVRFPTERSRLVGEVVDAVREWIAGGGEPDDAAGVFGDSNILGTDDAELIRYFALVEDAHGVSVPAGTVLDGVRAALEEVYVQGIGNLLGALDSLAEQAEEQWQEEQEEGE